MFSASTTTKQAAPAEILFCGHSAWEPTNGITIIPENTFLYVYAPLGAALGQAIPRALAAGVIIKPGDLGIKRISPLVLFNYNIEDKGENVGNYEKTILQNYPVLLKPGDQIENFNLMNAGDDALSSKTLTVINPAANKATRLSELLEQFKGNTCHFGGCSWVRAEFDKRNHVIFMDAEKNQLYQKPSLSEAEKKLQRAKRFDL
jgi:hypothetical protein